MRRLSIIDLPGGNQPMRSADGVTIVYNGEVYNYRELRSRLEADGHQFETQSDTEVVLQTYRAYGIAGVELLEGMFAFCIHDPKARTAHLVRDRIGIKPLYYAETPHGLAFGSEIKAILAGLDTRPALDRQAIHDYLTLRYVPSPATVWAGISKLEPGHRMRVDLESGTSEIKRWWDLDFVSQPEEEGRDYASEFEELFLAAVEKHLVAADVPVGVLLSGGLDSSAVSAAAVELGHRDFHTFSVGFSDGGEWSELAYARALSTHIGSRHHEVVVDRESFLAFLPELVTATDEPLADLASVPLHYVSKLAREHVKVVLSGEGADEVLAGYNLDETAAAIERWRRIDSFVPRPLLRAGARVVPAGRAQWLPVLAKHGWSGLLRGSKAHITRVFSEGEKRGLWLDAGELRPTEELVNQWYLESSSPHPLDQLQQVYCRSWLVEDLLMKADKISMNSSLELRVPFLDHALVEWASAAPMSQKVGGRSTGWQSKSALRSFAHGRVPTEILERPKQGFPVPAYSWLADSLGEWAEDRLLTDAGNPLAELFDTERLRPTVAEARAGEAAAAHKTWTMLVLREWLDQWANAGQAC
jgi:asparagine synthase (glutamine-hydrolysing)